MLVTLAGIVIELKSVASLNASTPILITDSLKLTLTKDCSLGTV